jgi:hypothetical protein
MIEAFALSIISGKKNLFWDYNHRCNQACDKIAKEQFAPVLASQMRDSGRKISAKSARAVSLG